MKAVVVEAPRKLNYVDIPKPELKPGWALIKVKAAALCATDLELIDGNISASYPIIPGHEWSGVVEDTGNEEDKAWIGKRVVGSNDICCLTCHACRSGMWRQCESFREIGFKANGAYAEYLTVPVYALSELPESISFTQGALIEPLGVAVGTLEKGQLTLSETVTIIGAGSIGLNILAVAKAMGARRTIVAAASERRLGYAKQMGAYATVATKDNDVISFVKDVHEGLSDLVVDATGAEECIRTSLRLAKKGGRVVLSGFGGWKEMKLYPDDVHINNLKLIGAGNNWNLVGKCINLLKDGLVSTENLATHFISLDEYEKGLEMTRTRPEGFIKAVFKF